MNNFQKAKKLTGVELFPHGKSYFWAIDVDIVGSLNNSTQTVTAPVSIEEGHL